MIAAEAGAHPVHCDVTLICERPKIGPYKAAMKAHFGLAAGACEYQSDHDGEARFYRQRRRSRRRGGRHMSARGGGALSDTDDLARRILEKARAAGLMVTTAESCTGGLAAGALTEIPGSSDVLDRGFVTYTNIAKMQMLGVREATLDMFGAVSEQTASEMATGALASSEAQLAVSITGVAGPGGGSVDKPVGLVWFGLAKADETVTTLDKRFGDIGRSQVRAASVRTALILLLDALG